MSTRNGIASIVVVCSVFSMMIAIIALLVSLNVFDNLGPSVFWPQPQQEYMVTMTVFAEGPGIGLNPQVWINRSVPYETCHQMAYSFSKDLLILHMYENIIVVNCFDEQTQLTVMNNIEYNDILNFDDQDDFNI